METAATGADEQRRPEQDPPEQDRPEQDRPGSHRAGQEQLHAGPGGHGSPQGDAPGRLSDRDQQVLAFERQWWRYAGAKDQAVRELFGLSATSYYQVLNALLDSPQALAHDPMLVKRLRRMRSQRQRSRSERRLGARGQA